MNDDRWKSRDAATRAGAVVGIVIAVVITAMVVWVIGREFV